MGLVLLASCALLAAAPPPQGPLPTVSIDLASLDRSTFEALEKAGLYQGLVVRLVTVRVALVDPTEPADIVLRMEPAGAPGEVVVTARGAAAVRSQRISIERLEQEAVRLRLLHAAVDLVRQVREAMPPPAPAAPKLLRARLALGGGVLWSAAKPGLLARLGGTTPVGPGELGVAVVLHRPSPGSGLSVTEWGLFGVVGTRERALGARLRAAVGLAVGLLQHRWEYAGESGSQLDAAALLHGAATFRPARSWRVGLAVGLLVTGREREHRTAPGTLWRAPRLRPFLGLEVGLGREAGN